MFVPVSWGLGRVGFREWDLVFDKTWLEDIERCIGRVGGEFADLG